VSTTSAAGGVLSRLELDDTELAGDRHDPDWLVAARRRAMGWVATHGFPTRKDEDWRYTALAPILDTPWERAPRAGVTGRASAAMVQSRVADLRGPRLVFVNGHFGAALSRAAALPLGVTVCSLAAALTTQPERLEPILSRSPDGPQHAFAAFNRALATDGAFVHLPAGASVAVPIHLVFVSDTGGEPLLSSPRCVVLADAGSRATIVETHIGFDGDVHSTNSVTDVVLAEGALVEHHKVQDEPQTAFHLALLDVRQGPGSRFTSHSMMFGGRIARQEVRVDLQGEGARVSLDGLALPHGEQVHDNTVFVDHAAPGCTSHQLYKSVLGGRARSVFNGHILVRSGADGTDANQKNKNLILSDRAEADTRPRLEIYADDVKCTHGAAVGQLDEEALLYLRSRGLTERGARALLVHAFSRELVDRVELTRLRKHIAALVESRSVDVE
jgi:Fe-S cluster assembly protein SufD